MPVETMTELLEAGVHYGHQTKRWNPRMRDFILEEKNSIHIIDLSKTVDQLVKAGDYLAGVAKQGGKILFVGCKKQAQEAVKEAAQASGQFYVNQRWLGGTLTNLVTIRKSVSKLIIRLPATMMQSERFVSFFRNWSILLLNPKVAQMARHPHWKD